MQPSALVLTALVAWPGHYAGAVNERAIAAVRRTSNAAIASRAIEALRGTWVAELQVTASSGDSIGGGEEMARRFSAAFEDPEFVTYDRKPTTIAISQGGYFGAEQGEWVGTWMKPDGKMQVRGVYLAQWQKRPEGWRIRSEVFVALSCRGSASCAERR